MVRWQWYEQEAEVRQAVMQMIAQAAADAIKARGAFHLVLAGGSTPRAVYQTLNALPTDWSAWRVYFGDERVLPADHPDRNSVMAQSAWLGQSPIPRNQIHPIPTELGLEAARASYLQTLAPLGAFDLVLLGLGEDGHTASLFPGHDVGAAQDASDVLLVLDAPKPPPQRITLSANRLSNARQVLFLVTGAGKREPVQRWMSGEEIPAASIQCANGVDVLLDRAAWPD
jgi:6-phosphogluconolactonase